MPTGYLVVSSANQLEEFAVSSLTEDEVLSVNGAGEIVNRTIAVAGLAAAGHDHSGVYSPVAHDHAATYAPIAHVTDDGSSHSFIDQSVTATASPSFGTVTLTTLTDSVASLTGGALTGLTGATIGHAAVESGENPRLTFYGYSTANSAVKNGYVCIDANGRLYFNGDYNEVQFGRGVDTIFSGGLKVADNKQIRFGGSLDYAMGYDETNDYWKLVAGHTVTTSPAVVSIQKTTNNIKFHNATYFGELAADPTEPAEGEAVIWMSDGTGYGDDGDVIIASKAAGTTTKAILFDKSAGAAWT